MTEQEGKAATPLVALLGSGDGLESWQEELAHGGYQTRTELDLEALLGVLNEDIVDLLVIDAAHVDVSIANLMSLIRESAPDLPVLVMNTALDAALTSSVLSSGLVWVVDPNMDVMDFHLAVQQLTGRRQRQRSLFKRFSQSVSWMQKASESLEEVMHELRTPVSIIQGYAANMLDGIDGELPEEAKISLGRIQIAARLMGSILGKAATDTLALPTDSTAALLAGIRVDGRRQIRLADLARESLSLFQERADGQSVTLSLEADPNLPMAWGSKARLFQALVNLIGNGLRHTPAGGQVTVEMTQDTIGENPKRAACRITVRDTGCGIPAENLDKIFERGFSTKEEKEGSGLGLAVCSEVAREHGALLTVESTPDVGTAFHLIIPVNLRMRRTTSTLCLLDDAEEALQLLHEIRKRRGIVAVMPKPEEVDELADILLEAGKVHLLAAPTEPLYRELVEEASVIPSDL